MHRIFLSALSLATLSGLAAGSTIRTDRPDSAYIALGSQFPSVGSLATGVGSGSGTLISPDWVLSAAHMYSGTNSGTFYVGGGAYSVDQVIVHPNWDLGLFDLSLSHLSTPVTGVTPSGYWGGGLIEVGQEATSVGFGTTGNGDTGNNGGYGTKRGFQNVIDGYDQVLWGFNYHGLLIDFDKPDGSTNTFSMLGSSSTPLDLEGCATPGDSGGGLFVNVGGKQVVVGVTSYVAWEGVDPVASRASNLYGYYGDNNGYSRVADAAQWIYSNTGIQPVPEPAPVIGVAFGLALLLRRRRRRAQGR